MLAMKGKVQMRHLYIIILFWTILCCLLVNLPVTTAQDITDNGLLLSTFAALDKLLDFFRNNYQQMTVDTVFGLRVVEGQCKLLAEEYDKKQLEFTPGPVMDEIRRLGIEAGKVANMAIPHIVDQDKTYFGLMKQLIVGPWKVFHPHRIANPSLRWDTPLSPSGFSETDSDHCLGELMGGPSANVTPCKVTENCLKSMLSPGQFGYQLHRQIFYTIVARKMNCEQQINDYLLAKTSFKNIRQLQHEFCSNAYYDIDESVSTHSLVPAIRDRFLEAEFLCPSLGYFQFMRSDWLEAILFWQSEKGCFGDTASSNNNNNNGGSANEDRSKNVSSLARPHPAGVAAAVLQDNQHAARQIQSSHFVNVSSRPKQPGNDASIRSTTVSDQLFSAIPRKLASPKQSSHDTAGIRSPQWASHSLFLKMPSAVMNNAVEANKPGRAVVDSHVVGVVNELAASQAPFYRSEVQHFAVPHFDEQPQFNGGVQKQDGHYGHSAYGPQAVQLYLPQAGVAYSVPNLHFRSNLVPDGTQHQQNSLQQIQQQQQHQQQQKQQQQQQFVWHNDVAYTANDEHHNQHFVPLVVPHHNEDEYESMGQVVEPHQQLPVAKKYPREVQEQNPFHPDNPFLVQYRLNRGLKMVDVKTPRRGVPVAKMPLHEKLLGGECWSRLTAMASAALTMYLRYQVDPGPPEFSHLRLGNYLRHQATFKASSLAAIGAPPHVVISSSNERLHVKINPSSTVGQVKLPLALGVGGKGPSDHKMEPPMNNVQAHHSSLVDDAGEHGNEQYSHVDRPTPDLTDMRSRAWNFMGMYQRQWGPRFPPIHVSGDYNLRNPSAVLDHVHKAPVPKDLPDWTVAYDPNGSATLTVAGGDQVAQSQSDQTFEDRTISTAPTWRRYKDVHEDLQGHGVGSAAKSPMQVRIEIHSPLQRDLDHYLIAVTVISILCLFVLFRYFRQRRGLSRGKTRNF